MKAVTNHESSNASPYTPQTLDLAITHLEQIMRSENAVSIFPPSYWRGRVLEAFATAGLVQRQQQRLSRLLDRLPAVSDVAVLAA